MQNIEPSNPPSIQPNTQLPTQNTSSFLTTFNNFIKIATVPIYAKIAILLVIVSISLGLGLTKLLTYNKTTNQSISDSNSKATKYKEEFDIWFDEKNSAFYADPLTGIGKFKLTGFVKSKRSDVTITKLEYGYSLCKALPLGVADYPDRCKPYEFKTIFDKSQKENPVSFSLKLKNHEEVDKDISLYQYSIDLRLFFRITNSLNHVFSALPSGCNKANDRQCHIVSDNFGYITFTDLYTNPSLAMEFLCKESTGSNVTTRPCRKDVIEASNMDPFSEAKNRDFAIWFDKDRTIFTTGVVNTNKPQGAKRVVTMGGYIQMNKGNIRQVNLTQVGCVFLWYDCGSKANQISDRDSYRVINLIGKTMHATTTFFTISVGEESDAKAVQYLEKDTGTSALVFSFEDDNGNKFTPDSQIYFVKPKVEPNPLYSVTVKYQNGKPMVTFPCTPKGDLCSKEWRITKNCPIDPEFSKTKFADLPKKECYLTSEEIAYLYPPSLLEAH